jgi:hypothetical protein
VPRVVRLGRPANDNHRRHGALRRLGMFGFSAALAALVLIGWRSIL